MVLTTLTGLIQLTMLKKTDSIYNIDTTDNIDDLQL